MLPGLSSNRKANWIPLLPTPVKAMSNLNISVCVMVKSLFPSKKSTLPWYERPIRGNAFALYKCNQYANHRATGRQFYEAKIDNKKWIPRGNHMTPYFLSFLWRVRRVIPSRLAASLLLPPAVSRVFKMLIFSTSSRGMSAGMA